MDAPSVNLDWEQALFRTARAVWRKFFPVPEASISEHAVFLADRERELSVLARVLGGGELQLKPSKGEGGVRGTDLLLPQHIDLSEDPSANQAVYTYRAVLGALYVQAQPEVDQLSAYFDTLQALVQASLEVYPNLEPLHHRCIELELASRPDLEALDGVALQQEKAIQAALKGETADPILDTPLATKPVVIWGRTIYFVGPDSASNSGDAPPAQNSSETDALDVEDITLLDIKEEDINELPVHVFEKIETLDNWSGGVRAMDGSDELDDHLEALDEVDLRDLIRGGEQAQAVIKADLSLEIEIPDVSTIRPGEKGISYPEWHYRKGRYRPDWSTVYPTEIEIGGDSWAAATTLKWLPEIEALRVKIRTLYDAMQPKPRQLDGEGIDIDAVVGEMANRRAGHGGDQRLYQRLHRRHWDMSVSVLLDLSLSSDGWVNGRRVLDVARESLLVLGEVLDGFEITLRIIGFASQTRNQIRAWNILHWNEPWSAGRARLGSLHPQGYTRIGPAIRHATADLQRETSRRKLLIVLSDGKPTDYDRYEGRYGIADVRHAVKDARNAGIRVHTLAIDSQSRDILPTMFGRGCAHLLPSPHHLPTVLTTLTAKMASR